MWFPRALPLRIGPSPSNNAARRQPRRHPAQGMSDQTEHTRLIVPLTMTPLTLALGIRSHLEPRYDSGKPAIW
jgi:hypothetical protein